MGDGERCGLLGKDQREFPDENDERINEDGENAILKFARQIPTYPGVWTKQRKFRMAPCPRHVGENRQDGNLIIIIPKNEGIVGEEKQAKDNGESGSDCCATKPRRRES